MTFDALCVLAIAGSVAALATSLVVALRSTPQRVRKAAYSAVEIAEETQNGFRNAANRMISFMEEVTRERESASADLQESERKRRQAAAKLSKLNGKNPEQTPEPETLAEVLAAYPPGDPRRMAVLRRAKLSMGEDIS